MSSILPSITVSSPNNKLSAPARQSEQESNDTGSFSEVLSRSMAPQREVSEKPGAKPATASTDHHRLEDEQQPGVNDLVNLMALALPAIENKTAKLTVASGGTAGVSETTTSVSNTDGLTRLLANDTQNMSLVALVPEVDAQADTSAEPDVLPLLVANAQKETGQAAGQTKLTQVTESLKATDSLAMPGDLAKMGSAANTADTNTSGQQQEGRQPSPRTFSNATVEAAPLVAPSSRATASNAAAASATASATAGATVTGPALVDASTSIDGALPVPPALSGIQGNAATAAPDAAPAAVSASLTPTVGSEAWGKALGQQVIHLGTSGQQVAELQLNPPGLGPLKVMLSMNEHQIQAMFVSAHSAVRSAVEAALPQLRATLAENGISLGNTSVSADNPQQQAAFTGQQDRPSSGRAYRVDNSEEAASPTTRASQPAPRPININGTGVDTYA